MSIRRLSDVARASALGATFSFVLTASATADETRFQIVQHDLALEPTSEFATSQMSITVMNIGSSAVTNVSLAGTATIETFVGDLGVGEARTVEIEESVSAIGQDQTAWTIRYNAADRSEHSDVVIGLR